MTLLPVIERELRSESRNAFTYWLRFFGAVALLGAGVLFFAGDGLGNMAGGKLFQVLHLTLFVAVWVVATLMTADSISRERREGTLGLLFLTPLRPFDIVLAKGLAHGLRAAGVCLAAVPVLVIPFLMGGVGWRNALAVVLIEFSALCWALAAGILASSFCRTLTRALIVAAMLDGLSFIALVTLQGAGLMTALRGTGLSRNWQPLPDMLFSFGWAAIIDTERVISVLLQRGNQAALSEWMFILLGIAVASLAVCLFAAVLAAFNIRRGVRDKGPSAAMQKMEKEFCTPTFAPVLFKRWMRRVLERNPVGWLERRTWQARLVTWSWLAVMVSILSWAVAQGFSSGRELTTTMTLLGWLLVANVALTAAGSLRRERESGVIELLLVSPLSIAQIIGGRLRGICGQFLPAVLLLFGSWLWLLHAFTSALLYRGEGVETGLAWIWFFAVTLLTIPVTGLYFSLRSRMFVVALFWTAGLGLALPWFVANLFWELPAMHFHDTPRALYAIFGIVAAGGALMLLRWRVATSAGLSILLASSLSLAALVSFASCVDGERWRGEDRLLHKVMLAPDDPNRPRRAARRAAATPAGTKRLRPAAMRRERNSKFKVQSSREVQSAKFNLEFPLGFEL